MIVKIYGRRFGSILTAKSTNVSNTPKQYVPFNDIIVRMMQDEPMNEKQLRGMK